MSVLLKIQPKPKLTVQYVRELLIYFPETGFLVWRIPRGNVAAGTRAGYIRADKGILYRYVKIDCKLYSEHKLAWGIMTGEFPPRLDHKDLDGTNNRWINLRLADGSQNQANTGIRSNNTSGYKGVGLIRSTGKWAARIKHQGNTTHLGCFSSPEKASAAYEKAARELFGEYARIR